jgi:hypothetical protein
MHLESKYPVGGEKDGVERIVLQSDLGRVIGRDLDNNSLLAGSHLVIDVPAGTADAVNATDPEALDSVLIQTEQDTFQVRREAVRAYIAEQVGGRFLRYQGLVNFKRVREVPACNQVRPIRPFTDPEIGS